MSGFTTTLGDQVTALENTVAELNIQKVQYKRDAEFFEKQNYIVSAYLNEARIYNKQLLTKIETLKKKNEELDQKLEDAYNTAGNINLRNSNINNKYENLLKDYTHVVAVLGGLNSRLTDIAEIWDMHKKKNSDQLNSNQKGEDNGTN